jgi:uncharacterized damage-inducible protein DinB
MTNATMTTVSPELKTHLLEGYQREVETTLKILRSYPASESEMRPHPTSMSARELAWTFVIEQGVCAAALRDELTMPPDAPPPPADTFDACIAAFEESSTKLAGLLEKTTPSALAGTFEFFVGPNQLGPVRKFDFLQIMLNDQIHHRGQLSVYLRMTGSKVPSIYGPSRDEPWF